MQTKADKGMEGAKKYFCRRPLWKAHVHIKFGHFDVLLKVAFDVTTAASNKKHHHHHHHHEPSGKQQLNVYL